MLDEVVSLRWFSFDETWKMDLLLPEDYIWACATQLKENLMDGFTTTWMACRHMKYLSCDEAGFMSLSCE